MNSKKRRPSGFVFAHGDRIGNADAAADEHFLHDCFVDTGHISILADPSRKERIIVGRTGSGKTALETHLRNHHQTCQIIRPEQLSLHSLSDIPIIRDLNSLGVHLELFYKLLWKHILAIELIKLRYRSDSPTLFEQALSQIMELVGRKSPKAKALDYLTEWSKEPWEDIKSRIDEMTTKLQTKATTEIGITFADIAKLSAKSEQHWEQDDHIKFREIQESVNKISLPDINNLIKLFEDNIFNTTQPVYYLCIDDIDAEWTDIAVKFKLIRALIDSIMEMARFSNAKIVVSIRHDLLRRVIRRTRNDGFQEEKLNDFCMNLFWNESDLYKVIQKRISHLIKRRYTKRTVEFNDIFPQSIGNTPTIEYMIDRTLLRPRDAILFVNSCIKHASGKSSITVADIQAAEDEYSSSRLTSIQEEWHGDREDLLKIAELLKRRSSPFKSPVLDDDLLTNFAESYRSLDNSETEVIQYCRRVLESHSEETEAALWSLRQIVLKILFDTGIVGLKTESHQLPRFSYRGHEVRRIEIDSETSVYISPAFHKVLGIRDVRKNSDKMN